MTHRDTTIDSMPTNAEAMSDQRASTGTDHAVLEKTASQPQYPSTGKALTIAVGVILTLFLTALDRLIIGTAIPTITNQFGSLDDVGWYGSSYLLTSCAFALFMGRIYTYYNPKWVYITCLVIFEVGSAVSGAAPTSTALIIGRAIAGLGNAGLFQGGVVIFCAILPLHKRPMYMGFMGMVFGIASAVGPLLGGVFTDEVSWRWCFYINLPIGALVVLLLVILLDMPQASSNDRSNPAPITIRQKVSNLDPWGTALFLPSIICLLLALQYGGVAYPWSNFRPILLLVLFGILLIGFTVVQYFKGIHATIPGNIIRNRSILAGGFFAFTTGGGMLATVYFLPIWFQAIKGASAVHSGIMNLPMILGLVIASIFSGILTRKIGYYVPPMLFSAILSPIGVGLLTTLTPSSGHAKWIGYQVIYGLGLGAGIQQPSVAAQTVLPRRDVPTGASLMFFSQTLGGALFVSIANNIFNSHLLQSLRAIPGIDAAIVSHVGATELRQVIPDSVWPQVQNVYNDALRQAFIVSLVVNCLSVIGAAAMQWRSVKANMPSKQQQQQQQQQPKTSSLSSATQSISDAEAGKGATKEQV